MGKILFNLPDAQKARLKEESERRGTSVSECLRDAIDLYLHAFPVGMVVMSGQIASGYAMIVRSR